MVTSGQSLLQISQFLYGKSYNFNSWQSYSCQLTNALFSPAIFSRLLRKLIWETERELIWETERGNSLNISLLKCRNARGDRNGRFNEMLSNRVVVHMDLTILTNCSQIRQSEISLADLMILTNFLSFLSF